MLQKAEKASDFAQTEVIPELKKIYDAATAEDKESTTRHDLESSTLRDD